MNYKFLVTRLFDQRITDSTGTETFAKKPKLAKLLQELNPTPMLQFAVFWVFC